MKRAPFKDPQFGQVDIRADGRALHNMFLFQVKTPAGSRGAWDDHNLIGTTPGASTFRLPQPGLCSLAR